MSYNDYYHAIDSSALAKGRAEGIIEKKKKRLMVIQESIDFLKGVIDGDEDERETLRTESQDELDDSRINNITKRINQNKARLADYRSEVAELQRIIAESQNKLTEAEKEFHIDEYKGIISKLDSYIGSNRHDIRNYQREIKWREGEIARLETRLVEQDAIDVKYCKNKINEYKAEITDFHNNISKAQEKIEELEIEKTGIESNIEYLEMNEEERQAQQRLIDEDRERGIDWYTGEAFSTNKNHTAPAKKGFFSRMLGQGGRRSRRKGTKKGGKRRHCKSKRSHRR